MVIHWGKRGNIAESPNRLVLHMVDLDLFDPNEGFKGKRSNQKTIPTNHV